MTRIEGACTRARNERWDARAAVYGEPTIVPREEPAAEVVAVAKRDLEAGEKLGGTGAADYYGCVYEAEAAGGMLPLGLAAGARTKRPVKRGNVTLRSDAELVEKSFVVSLRRLQEAALAEENV